MYASHVVRAGGTPARVLLRALREVRGVTQQGWAGLLGYSVATVRRWETGNAVPTAEAEAGLIKQCQERGLFRAYESGPLRGVNLTQEVLRAVLAEARLQVSGPPRQPTRAGSAPAAPLPATNLPADDIRESGLPVPMTGLIGREVELETIQGLLQTARLVTLTGPGGSGKTRTAVEVAHTLARQANITLTWVDLTPLRDPDLVLLAIAQALGVREAAGQPLLRTVLESVRLQDRLLILDNFEQVLDAGTVVAELLRGSRRLTVLATSRARLNLYGEHEYPIAPLLVPAGKGPADADPVDLAKYPSVALFVQRAKAANPAFALTDANAASVAAICRRLDGLPLALELAAVRARSLPAETLFTRLTASLDVLVGGARDLPIRQQTLRATLDWSYDLLEPDVQRLFRCLGVFAGTYGLEAVEAISSVHGSSAPIPDAIDRLVSESLVRQEPRPNGEARFSMLETIREYALERLKASGETDAICQRHAAFFVDLAEAAEPRLVGVEQAGWFDRLEFEHANIRAALQWSLESQQIEMALRLASALWRFWETRGYLSEGQQWLEKGLAQQSLTPAIAAKALTAAGSLARVRGDLPRARALHTESLRLFRGIDNSLGIARSLSNLGVVAKELCEYAEAAALYAESLAIRRELGDQWAVAVLLVNLGEVAREQGRLEEARSFYMESRKLFEELGDGVGIAVALNNLGEVARDAGDYPAALELHQSSYELRRQLGDKLGTARAAYNLARLALRQEQYERSAERFAESLTLCNEVGAEQDALQCLESLAELVAARGQARESLLLLGNAAGLRVARGVSVSASRQVELERVISGLRAALDQTTFATAWAEGQSMDINQAMRFGLTIAQTPGVVTVRAEETT